MCNHITLDHNHTKLSYNRRKDCMEGSWFDKYNKKWLIYIL
jgi:hypothetical protein